MHLCDHIAFIPKRDGKIKEVNRGLVNFGGKTHSNFVGIKGCYKFMKHRFPVIPHYQHILCSDPKIGYAWCIV